MRRVGTDTAVVGGAPKLGQPEQAAAASAERQGRRKVTYPEEYWVDRWERVTGIRPNAVKVKMRGSNMACRTFKFIDGADQ